MSDTFSPEQEAQIFGSYLLGGKSPNASSIALYADAMKKKHFPATDKDVRRLNFALKNKWTIGMIDSGLAFGNPNAILRKKILLMSAILETQPEYASLFLPQERSFTYNLFIFRVGFRAVMKAIAGKIILLLI